jgi:hypothetical protein
MGKVEVEKEPFDHPKKGLKTLGILKKGISTFFLVKYSLKKKLKRLLTNPHLLVLHFSAAEGEEGPRFTASAAKKIEDARKPKELLLRDLSSLQGRT